MLEPKALHINRPLSNLSVQYKNEAMIWREILPVIRVGERSDVYFKYTKENAYRLADDKIGPKSLANEISLEVSTDNYSVKDHALADWLPQETIDNADAPLSPAIDVNDNLNMLLDVAQEKRAADLVFAAATYPTGNKVTLSGTAQWGQSADAPISDIQTAIETCFQRANTLVFGLDAWLVFRRLPEILDAVKSSTRSQSTPGGLATAPEVASLFDVDRILIGRSRYITSKEGQTATFARLWGKHMAALHVLPSPGIRSITFGATFSESERLTMTEFDVKRGVKGAQYIKVGWNSDEKVIASDLGYLITDAVP